MRVKLESMKRFQGCSNQGQTHAILRYSDYSRSGSWYCVYPMSSFIYSSLTCKFIDPLEQL